MTHESLVKEPRKQTEQQGIEWEVALMHFHRFSILVCQDYLCRRAMLSCHALFAFPPAATITPTDAASINEPVRLLISTLHDVVLPTRHQTPSLKHCKTPTPPSQ